MNCLIAIFRPGGEYTVIPHTIKLASETDQRLNGALIAFRAENPHTEFMDVRIEITFEKINL